MKKIFFVVMFALLASSLTFAAAKGTGKKSAGGGNGNGGIDKIGGYVGSPFGLSYSHEFNDLVELDLVAGYSGLWRYHSLDVQIGALFTVFDPVISGLGDQHCPLSLGPVLGGSVDFVKYPVLKKTGSGYFPYSYVNETLVGGSVSLLLPVRWEINFGNIPDFNLFIEWAPVGITMRLVPYKTFDSYTASGDIVYKKGVTTAWHYDTRFGVGLRYRIPNKK